MHFFQIVSKKIALTIGDNATQKTRSAWKRRKLSKDCIEKVYVCWKIENSLWDFRTWTLQRILKYKLFIMLQKVFQIIEWRPVIIISLSLKGTNLISQITNLQQNVVSNIYDFSFKLFSF